MSITLSFAIGLKKLIITINKMLDNKVINLNLSNFLENRITKIAERLILKKAALSPLKKIKASDKINISIKRKKKLFFF